MEKKHILCLFDYGPECMTGYATVSRNIVQQLKQHFGEDLTMDICAINYFGEPYTEYDGTVKVCSAKNEQLKLPAAEELKTGDDFGLLFFMEMLKNINYHSIFYIGDLGLIAPIVPLIEMIRQEKFLRDQKGFTSVIYFPVDGPLHPRVKNPKFDKSQIGNVPKRHRHLFGNGDVCQVDTLEFFDVAVTYTDYGKKEVLKIRPDFKDRLFVINHGTNTTDFFPMEAHEIETFRRKYFGWNAKKYIVGCINRNQPRKDIPTAIFGFIEAKKHWDKSLPAPFLYLHMHPNDPKGWDLRALLSLTDLEENKDYMFPVTDDVNYQVNTATLNKIYNSIDVYLSTARGGGWELPVTECMSVGNPCIIPEHTSLAEIAMDGNNAFLLTELLPVCDHTDNTIRQMCHHEEVGEQIQFVASQHAAAANKAQNAYQWITGLTWDKICLEWIEIFEAI